MRRHSEKARRKRMFFERLESRRLLVTDPRITEFQAANDTTLADEDGDFSDWIEIHNPNDQPLNLAGWYLTDDLDQLTKWQFPAAQVDAESSLVVFASNKDRANGPQNEYHTNFRLSAQGESLALVRPDGTTIVHHYDAFPPQQLDQSYGIAEGRDAIQMIDRRAPARALIPTDGDLGETWWQAEFDDATWSAGQLGVGYEVVIEQTTVTTNFAEPLGPDWAIDLPNESRSTVNLNHGGLVLTVPGGDTLDYEDRGVAPIVSRSVPTLPPGVTTYEVVAHIHQGPEDDGRAGLAVIDDAGLPAVQIEYSSANSFRSEAAGRRVGNPATSRDQTAYFLRLQRTSNSWITSFRITPDDAWRMIAEVVDEEQDRAPILNPKLGVYARSPTGEITATIDQFDVIIPPQPPQYGPHLRTLVPEMNGASSSLYIRIPFELDVNPTMLDELTLTATADDGFVAYLNGEPLTMDGVPLSVNAPEDLSWNSNATSSVTSVTSLPLGRYDIKSSIGALREGRNVLAIHGVNANVMDRDFFLDATLAGATVLPDVPQMFLVPTPGLPNRNPTVPTPIIDGAEGLFFGSTNVTLSLPEPIPAVEIRYTLDGSDPTPASTRYTDPLTLTTSAMLQARAFDFSAQPRFDPSAATAATFISVDPNLRDTSSNLPLLVLDGFGDLPPTTSNELVNMNVVMLGVDSTGRTQLSDTAPVEYIGRGGARSRGSSTGNQPKPNMTFETWGPHGTHKDDDHDVSWLGMAPEADWVLHAPFAYDQTYIRNPLAFELSNQMGHWAPHYQFVEVYVDGAGRDGRADGDDVISNDDFMGIYVLLEKIEQGQDRVAIAETNPEHLDLPEISGGYIWKIDRSDPDAAGFVAGQQEMQWVYPKGLQSRTARDDQKATPEQQAWVIEHIDAFQSTLSEPDLHDPNGYSKYIDPISWIDQHLINVFMMNVDALRLSAFFHKDTNNRIKYGPVWDFDRSADSSDDRDDNPFVWRSEAEDGGTDFFGNGTQEWWGDLFRDPAFWQLYVDRWQTWRDSVLSDENIAQIIDTYAEQLTEGAERSPFSQTQPRSESGYENHRLDGTYQGELENLKQWLRDRAQFMDANFARPAEVLIEGVPLPASQAFPIQGPTDVVVTPPNESFYLEQRLIPTEAIGRYLVLGDDTLGDTWTHIDFDDQDWNQGALGFGYGNVPRPFVRTIVEPNAEIPGSTTFLTRIDFQLDDLAMVQGHELLLRARYDDGFMVYLNGEELFAENLRDEPLAWNSRALTAFRTRDALEFDLTSHTNLLVEGTNTLSFRVINTSVGSNDMLLEPELVLRQSVFGVHPTATAIYTLDGSDPRAPNGQPSAGARSLDGGGTITIEPGTRLTVRNLDDWNRGEESEIVLTNWSRPRTFDFIAEASAKLEISEVHYHPSPPSPEELAAGFVAEDFQYIELHNFGRRQVHLAGMRLTGDIEFDLSTAPSIAPNDYVIAAANSEALRARYGLLPNVLGEFDGDLSKSNALIQLRDGLGRVISAVDYHDSAPWPLLADGLGSSLELVQPATNDSLLPWYRWHASAEPSGTPGHAPSDASSVVINEIFASPNDDQMDAIELFNATTVSVDLTGWFLSDSPDNLFAFEIAPGTTIPPEGYLVLTAAEFDRSGDADAFGLSGRNGDRVFLTQGSQHPHLAQGGIVTRYEDSVQFRATPVGESLGRFPNGRGRLVPLAQPSLGALNQLPRIGPLVISEVQFRPTLSAAAIEVDPMLDVRDLEYVEIHNASQSTVDLAGWRISGAVRFDFESSTQLHPGATLAVLRFDPHDPKNETRVRAFKAHYSAGEDLRSVGGYGNRNADGGDLLILLRPDRDRDPSDPPFVLEEEVAFDALGPWPKRASADHSLQRRFPLLMANHVGSWTNDHPGRPGEMSGSIRVDFNRDARLDSADIDGWFVRLQEEPRDQRLDLNHDEIVDENDRDVFVRDWLGLAYGDADLNGRFDQQDLAIALAAGEYEDDLTANSTWTSGDWNGDGEFTSEDIVFAFTHGKFAD